MAHSTPAAIAITRRNFHSRQESGFVTRGTIAETESRIKAGTKIYFSSGKVGISTSTPDAHVKLNKPLRSVAKERRCSYRYRVALLLPFRSSKRE